MDDLNEMEKRARRMLQFSFAAACYAAFVAGFLVGFLLRGLA